MSTLSTDKLVFFPTDLADSNMIGANVLDGYGVQINSTVVSGTNTSLDVFSALADGYGTKISSTGGSLNVNLTSSGNALDTNYGTVGVNTLRTAAQIGNATGAADFNRGATGAQTLRVTNNNSDGYGIAISSTLVGGKQGLDVNIIDPITVTMSYDQNYGTVGATTLRTAAQIGNATGAADFNNGVTGAQTLRTTANLSDGYGIKISSTAGSLNVALTTATGGALDTNYGTVGANTLRSAAQIGNATGAADFNRGATGAQTLRVNSNLNDGYGIQLQSTGGALNVGGSVADGSTDSGNPVKVGSRVVTAPLTTATAGNRADLISDLYRRLYINDSPNIAIASAGVSVTTSAATLIASALGGRRRMMIQNLGNKPIYVGQTGVTNITGFRISASGTLSIELGPDVAVFAIADSGTQDVRVLELA